MHRSRTCPRVGWIAYIHLLMYISILSICIHTYTHAHTHTCTHTNRSWTCPRASFQSDGWIAYIHLLMYISILSTHTHTHTHTQVMDLSARIIQVWWMDCVNRSSGPMSASHTSGRRYFLSLSLSPSPCGCVYYIPIPFIVCVCVCVCVCVF